MQILQHCPARSDPGLVSFPVSGNQALMSCDWMHFTERPGNKHLHTLGRFPMPRSRQGVEGVDAGAGEFQERTTHLAVLEPHWPLDRHGRGHGRHGRHGRSALSVGHQRGHLGAWPSRDPKALAGLLPNSSKTTCCKLGSAWGAALVAGHSSVHCRCPGGGYNRSQLRCGSFSQCGAGLAGGLLCNAVLSEARVAARSRSSVPRW